MSITQFSLDNSRLMILSVSAILVAGVFTFLDYEVLFNGKPQNPAKFLTAGDQIFKD